MLHRNTAAFIEDTRRDSTKRSDCAYPLLWRRQLWRARCHRPAPSHRMMVCSAHSVPLINQKIRHCYFANRARRQSYRAGLSPRHVQRSGYRPRLGGERPACDRSTWRGIHQVGASLDHTLQLSLVSVMLWPNLMPQVAASGRAATSRSRNV
jgi:hypothetical protein